MPRIPGRTPGLLTILIAGLTLAACSGSQPASPAVFRVQDGVQPNAADQPCQLHQTHAPTTAYRGGPDGTTDLELPFLAYYTANGDKAYCDGKPPTATDNSWARLYVDLTGNTQAVHRILTG